jgi:hypothetical protein
MKRADALFFFQRAIDNYLSSCHGAPDTADMAKHILKEAEDIGMKPPCLPDEDCQAITQVYYGGYTFYQWEEDYVKDEKVAEAKRKRAEWRSKREDSSN